MDSGNEDDPRLIVVLVYDGFEEEQGLKEQKATLEDPETAQRQGLNYID